MKDILAFPQPINPNEQGRGMTLRDYFAAKAMQGILSDPRNDDVRPSYVSEWAYKIADAMMKAREA
jgi:hypothetical protein